MTEFRRDAWFSAAAMALSLAVAAAWLLGGWLPLPFFARCALLGLSLTLAGGSVAWVIRRVGNEQQAARRYLDLLCRQECLAPNLESSENLPALDPRSKWTSVFEHMRETFKRHAERLVELEQSRAALEIRARRNETRVERVDAIIASLSEPIIAVDQYNELVLANPSAERLFGFQPGNTEQRALGELLRCEKLVEMLSEVRRRRGSSHRTSEVEIADHEGCVRAYSAMARSLPGRGTDSTGGDDAGHGVVAVLRDISGQKAIQKRNAEFVSAVSHEMKTPLAGIKAYVELLADDEADDEATRDEFLNVIDAQADRLQRLVENLLNLARIEAGVVVVKKQPQPLNDILEEAFSVVQPASTAKGLTMVTDLSPMYLGVLVDRDMLLQAAINLLSNAVKYTPDGGTVTLRSRLADGGVLFEVEDTGIGLDEADLHKVFQKFYRVQRSKEMSAGTGLGLALSKHIVEDVHGGQLTVDSKLNVGSTFRVTLPSAGDMD